MASFPVATEPRARPSPRSPAELPAAAAPPARPNSKAACCAQPGGRPFCPLGGGSLPPPRSVVTVSREAQAGGPRPEGREPSPDIGERYFLRVLRPDLLSATFRLPPSPRPRRRTPRPPALGSSSTGLGLQSLTTTTVGLEREPRSEVRLSQPKFKAHPGSPPTSRAPTVAVLQDSRARPAAGRSPSLCDSDRRGWGQWANRHRPPGLRPRPHR